MNILTKHLTVVKEQTEFHQKMAEKFRTRPVSPYRAALHQKTADQLGELFADLQKVCAELDGSSTAALLLPAQADPKGGPIQLSLSPEELNDLPQELIDQLTGADKTEFAIINATEDAGGVITLDRLLIALYRKTGEVHKREQLTSRLYRMGQKNLMFNVPGKKGVYSTEQLSLEDAAKLFGTLKQKT